MNSDFLETKRVNKNLIVLNYRTWQLKVDTTTESYWTEDRTSKSDGWTPNTTVEPETSPRTAESTKHWNGDNTAPVDNWATDATTHPNSSPRTDKSV